MNTEEVTDINIIANALMAELKAQELAMLSVFHNDATQAQKDAYFRIKKEELSRLREQIVTKEDLVF